MKRVYIVLWIVIYVFLCSSCSGYNGIMYRHLSEEDNYKSYQVQLQSIYYLDPKTNTRINDFTAKDFTAQTVYFEVVFCNYEDVRSFLGATPNEIIPLADYTFSLQLTKENCEALINNGFYEDIVLGKDLEIRASDFIYMDSDFFYVAEVKYNETVYLDFNTGIDNIIDMMRHDRSLF